MIKVKGILEKDFGPFSFLALISKGDGCPLAMADAFQ